MTYFFKYINYYYNFLKNNFFIMVNQNKYLTRDEMEKDIDKYIEKSADDLILELKNKRETLCIK